MMSMLNPITKRLSTPLIKLVCCSMLLVSGAAYSSQQSSAKKVQVQKIQTAKAQTKQTQTKKSSAKASTKTAQVKTAQAKSSKAKTTQTKTAKSTQTKATQTKTAQVKSVQAKSVQAQTALSKQPLLNGRKSFSMSSSSTSMLRYPTADAFPVTSHFNPERVNPVTRKRMPHKGIDFSMPIGSTVISTGAGEVVIAKFSRSAGNYIVIRHANGYSTQYMHLSKLMVTEGQKVKQGQKIGLSGNTGRSTAAHLHYELWSNDRPIDPLSSQFNGMAVVNNFRYDGTSAPSTTLASANISKGSDPFASGSSSRDLQSASRQDGGYETQILGDGKILYTRRASTSEAN